MATASVHVNKLAAAKRQLQAAIRMYFSAEDDLAIHTVAAAAYGLLKDIKRARGMSEAAEMWKVSLFYIVRDFHRGSLPEHMTSDPVFMAEVQRLANELYPITADSKLSDVAVSITPQLEKEYWDDSNRAANFLKHADWDGGRTLPLDELDNYTLRMKCWGAYQDVAPDELGNEGLMFQAYVCANNSSWHGDDTSFGSLVWTVRDLPVERRGEACFKVIREMNDAE